MQPSIEKTDRELDELLRNLPPETSTMVERRLWAYSLVSWLRRNDELRTPRFKLLIEHFDKDRGGGTFRERFSFFLNLGWSSVRFLSEAGIPQQSSLFQEAANRIMSRIIPSIGITGDMYDFIRRMIPLKKDVEWLERIPQDLVNEFGELCKIRKEDIVTAVLVVAHRVSGAALAPWRLRLHPNLETQSKPWFSVSHSNLYYPHGRPSNRLSVL